MRTYLQITHSPIPAQSGIALATTFLVMLVMLALVITTFELSTSELRLTTSYRESNRSFIYADAINRAVTRVAFDSNAPITGLGEPASNLSDMVSISISVPTLSNNIADYTDIQALLGGINNAFYYEVSCQIVSNDCPSATIITNGLSASQLTVLNSLDNALIEAIGITTTGANGIGNMVEFNNVRRFLVQISYINQSTASSNSNNDNSLTSSTLGGGQQLPGVTGTYCNMNVRTQVRLNNNVTSTINQGFRLPCAS